MKLRVWDKVVSGDTARDNIIFVRDNSGPYIRTNKSQPAYQLVKETLREGHLYPKLCASFGQTAITWPKEDK